MYRLLRSAVRMAVHKAALRILGRRLADLEARIIDARAEIHLNRRRSGRG